jgi:hypothetical protein
MQERASYHLGRATILLISGDAVHALEAAQIAFDQRGAMGITQEYAKQAFVTAVEAALALDEIDKAEELLGVVEALPRGSSSQFLQAQAARFRALLSARRGETEEAERRFKRATGLFRELALVFYLGIGLLEYGEWLVSQNRAGDAEPLLAEARATFERLEATPWLERAGQAALGSSEREALTGSS